MADIKKEQERDELHRAIWAIADDLRGSVDGWDFKSYVLGTMFYRYISENITEYINQGEWDAGNTDFDYAKLSDAEAEQAREGLIEEKGFFILPSELFCNVRKRATHDENLNMTLETVFNHIEDSAKGSDSENSFAGLFDDFDVNSNKLGATVAKRNEKLVKLLNGVGDMNLGDVKGHDIDAFGDAYEYLMTMYASNAGKSGGEFFTPADVSELLTRLGTVGKKEVNKVYDPACGSGSLLLKAEKVLGRDGVRNGFFGQEINITTYNLCRINMFLHDVGFDHFDIACEDTLTSPQHWDDEPFELIVSNPPYSIKWEGDDNPLLINDPRFSPAGVLAPKSKADLAFIMHSLSWLAPNGTAAIVCFPGVMTRGGAEQKIRKYLIDNNFVDCIIQLPTNLFFGTSIATCIMVMKRNKSDNKTLFIDATNECIKVTNNNKLTVENIEKIVEVYSSRQSSTNISKLAPYEEIVKNNYNLSVSNYVFATTKVEWIDIKKLNDEIEEIVRREEIQREEIKKIIDEIETLQISADVRKVKLGDIGPVCMCKRILKAQTNSSGGVPFYKIGTFGKEPDAYISPETFYEYKEKYNYPKKGEVLISAAGTIGRTVVYDGEPAYFQDSNIVWISNDETIVLNSFLKYCYAMKPWKISAGGTIARLYNDDIREAIIPAPPLDVQARIVSMLERFDRICNDIQNGLPAEIIARKKQYEYYRNKLLTLDELQN